MPPRSILAVTDFSQQGGHALARAALCCAEHGATLKIVYLAEAGEAPPSDTDVRLAHHAVQLGQRYDIAVQAATQTACDAEQVARKASDADLVVWGTAPVQGLRAWFTTHPALRMLRTCPRPVIVVRNPAHQPYQGLMVAVDFSRASHSLVDLGLALHPCARVELFHAISTANEGKLRYAEVSERAIQIYREQCRRSAQDRMVTLTDSHDARRNRLSSSIGRGDPARFWCSSNTALRTLSSSANTRHRWCPTFCSRALHNACSGMGAWTCWWCHTAFKPRPAPLPWSGLRPSCPCAASGLAHHHGRTRPIRQPSPRFMTRPPAGGHPRRVHGGATPTVRSRANLDLSPAGSIGGPAVFTASARPFACRPPAVPSSMATP
jgi:nucleotide-binding universal stress UspA family protein